MKRVAPVVGYVRFGSAFLGIALLGSACQDPIYAEIPCDPSADAGPGTKDADATASGRCTVVSECAEASEPCYKDVSCTDGRCAYRVKGFDEPVGDDPQAGDCHRPLCDGLGKLVNGIDDSDAPDDGNPCTIDFCIEGFPHDIHPKQEDGTPCALGGVSGTCSSGNCVASG